MPHDDLLAALVRAIALELIQAGYQPGAMRGYAQQGRQPARLIAEEVWQAMTEIIAGDERGEIRDTARVLRAEKPEA